MKKVAKYFSIIEINTYTGELTIYLQTIIARHDPLVQTSECNFKTTWILIEYYDHKHNILHNKNILQNLEFTPN